MQAIIVTGTPKEIAALALEMQERQRNQTINLSVAGEEISKVIASHLGNRD